MSYSNALSPLNSSLLASRLFGRRNRQFHLAGRAVVNQLSRCILLGSFGLGEIKQAGNRFGCLGIRKFLAIYGSTQIALLVGGWRRRWVRTPISHSDTNLGIGINAAIVRPGGVPDGFRGIHVDVRIR